MPLIFVAQENYQSLYNHYNKSLILEGEAWFRENILDVLRAEEKEGIVLSTGAMDENTSIRRSAIPVETRVSAAEGALIDYLADDGLRQNAGGVRSMGINRGGGMI